MLADLIYIGLKVYVVGIKLGHTPPPPPPLIPLRC